MTPEQSWQMIANLCRQMKLSIDEHQQVQAALQVLKPKAKLKNEDTVTSDDLLAK